MEEDMSEALAQAFSSEEFTAAIKHLSKDKAPGLFMVNSNISKAWDAGMSAYVHSMMQVLCIGSTRQYPSGGRTMFSLLSPSSLETRS
jgi:hypothetical protein